MGMSKYAKTYKSIKNSQQETVSTVSSLTTPHGDQIRVSSQLHKQMQLQSSHHALAPLGHPLISYAHA